MCVSFPERNTNWHNNCALSYEHHHSSLSGLKHCHRCCVRTNSDSPSYHSGTLSRLFTATPVPGWVYTNWISSQLLHLTLVTFLPDPWHHLGPDTSPLLPPFVLAARSWDNQGLNEQPLDVAASSGDTVQLQIISLFITFYLKSTKRGKAIDVSSFWSCICDRFLQDASTELLFISSRPNRPVPQFSVDKFFFSHLSSVIHDGTLILRMIISECFLGCYEKRL